MEVLGDVGAVGEVDVEVQHAVAFAGDRAEGAVHARAPAAHLGAELQERRLLAERRGAESLRVDDLAGVDVAGAILLPPQERADTDRHGEEGREQGDGVGQVHSGSA